MKDCRSGAGGSMRVPGALALLGAVGACSEEAADTAFQRYLLVPFGAYAEETGLQVGFLSMLFARPSDRGEPGGMLMASGVVTTEGQRMAMLGPSGSLAGGKARYSAFLQYSDWPGKYWEGGDQPDEREWTYSMRVLRLNGNVTLAAAFLPGLPDSAGRHLWAGLQYDLERNVTAFDAPGDSMAAALGLRAGGHRIGLGPTLQWDTRDHQGAPTRGLLLSAGKVWNRKAWGSDWDFSKATLDLRGYTPLPWSTVLALSAFWEDAEGQVPFDRLAMPDGRNRLRGLSKGRLRDAQQLTLQSELRFPIAGRFSGTAFAEAGKVGKSLEALRDNGFHYGFGGGLRFSVNPQRKLNFRTDIAWVDDGVGVAASFGEAF